MVAHPALDADHPGRAAVRVEAKNSVSRLARVLVGPRFSGTPSEPGATGVGVTEPMAAPDHMLPTIDEPA
jgi:hypothetical protein